MLDVLPPFVLGCMMKRPEGTNPRRDDARPGHQEGPESPTEQHVTTLVSGAFMLLVGLSIASVFAGVDAASAGTKTITAQQAIPDSAC